MPEASELDWQMMQRALTLAEAAGAVGEVPIGAVVYRGEQVLAEAHNRRELDRDPTAHAELIAMREAAGQLESWRLIDCSVAVTLEPCPMCAGAMVNARLSRCVYGATDPKMGCVQTLHELLDDARFNHRVEAIGGVMAAESVALLQAFFKSRRSGSGPAKPRHR